MKSLYVRVLFMTLAVILLSSMLGFLLSNIYYHVKLKPFNDTKLIGIATQMSQFLEQNPAEMDRYLDNAAALGYEIYVTDGQGDQRFYGRTFREHDLAATAVAEVLQGGAYHGVSQFPNKLYISGFFENTLSNTVGVPVVRGGHTYALFVRPDVLLQFGELRTFFALIFALTIAISVLCFLLSTRYLVKPITRLSEATKRIAQGNYNLKLPDKRKDEIGQLAGHFMTMSRELERIEEARQQFVANVSHEIQSPLTSMQGFAHILAERELPSEEREHYAKIIETETKHLSMLGKQLLTLSSLEQGIEAMNKAVYPLRAQLRQAVQVMQWQLDEKELFLKLAVPETVTVYGDEVLLMQVWMNVIGNAIQHIPAGSSIEISAESGKAEIVVEIRDTGEGIAPEHVPFLFDRFYRVDRARERASGRTGLGLAIVKKIVGLHGGDITVHSILGEGTTFRIELPQL
ncbi:sensor histidine kinase [Paenibacillus whitsoniae]|uniref:Heme sensor protein HssS n=1 Tax=Paenibacillus whitsoniae TaxID=2496558 RepID=A0A430JDG8_9BACL|nr:HAMP domain-containing sensor histidine kinase [Paenibacillus whitsoniae]RTE09044.1 sensor histidine kinase [Paenibacillus whitsoniae]